MLGKSSLKPNFSATALLKIARIARDLPSTQMIWKRCLPRSLPDRKHDDEADAAEAKELPALLAGN